MGEGLAGPWEIYQPPELDPQLEALAGKGAGLRRTLELLAENPCDPALGGYRRSGPLEPVVCGAHLKRGYRIAYTTQPPLTQDDKPRVDNPPDGHHKPPCCQADLPEIDHDALRDFRRALTHLNRPRRRRT